MNITHTIELPVNYNNCSAEQRVIVRNEYIRIQKGICSYCGNRLDKQPHESVRCLVVDKSLFPKGFFDYPIHLHHDHKTGATKGAVHKHCNAVLWQYHNE